MNWATLGNRLLPKKAMSLEDVQTAAAALTLADQRRLLAWLQGATVPFIARYRKERTGGMDEVQLRSLQERYAYLTELAATASRPF
jgi:transcriptional accessory protein Tex/SPT6